MLEVVEIPSELALFQFPDAVQARLQSLLDRQDEGGALSQAERQEAEGLVELAEFLSLLRLRSTQKSMFEKPKSNPPNPLKKATVYTQVG